MFAPRAVCWHAVQQTRRRTFHNSFYPTLHHYSWVPFLKFNSKYRLRRLLTIKNGPEYEWASSGAAAALRVEGEGRPWSAQDEQDERGRFRGQGTFLGARGKRDLEWSAERNTFTRTVATTAQYWVNVLRLTPASMSDLTVLSCTVFR